MLRVVKMLPLVIVDLHGRAPRAVLNQAKCGLIGSRSAHTGYILGRHREMLPPQRRAVWGLSDRTWDYLYFLFCIFWKCFLSVYYFN